MNNRLLNIALYTISLMGTACSTVGYYEPFELSQNEIHSMSVLSRDGTQLKRASGLTRDCSLKSFSPSQSCSQIVCKNAEKQPTGLSCLYYVPNDIPQMMHTTLQSENNSKAALKNDDLDAKADAAILALKNNNESPLITMCKEENILCFVDNLIYPPSTSPTKLNNKVESYKRSYSAETKLRNYNIEVNFTK